MEQRRTWNWALHKDKEGIVAVTYTSSIETLVSAAAEMNLPPPSAQGVCFAPPTGPKMKVPLSVLPFNLLCPLKADLRDLRVVRKLVQSLYTHKFPCCILFQHTKKRHTEEEHQKLPDETIQCILGHLDVEQLVRIAEVVCKRWRSNALDESLWRRLSERDYGMQSQGEQSWRSAYIERRTRWKCAVNPQLTTALFCGRQVISLSSDSNQQDTTTAIFHGMDGCRRQKGSSYFGREKRNARNQVGVIQRKEDTMLLPVGDTPFFSYFEVEIMEIGKDKSNVVGVGVAPRGYASGQPGWHYGSFGYHSDDGRAFYKPGFRDQSTSYGPTFSKGDVVGCITDYHRKEISYTHNGKWLGIAFDNCPTVDLVPTIGMMSEGEKVDINFGGKPFQFDVMQYSREHAPRSEVTIPPPEILYTPQKRGMCRRLVAGLRKMVSRRHYDAEWALYKAFSYHDPEMGALIYRDLIRLKSRYVNVLLLLVVNVKGSPGVVPQDPSRKLLRRTERMIVAVDGLLNMDGHELNSSPGKPDTAWN
ncbi:ran-binding protein 9 [Planoprotostelium fungivorum]|uniref:Ran-binding protein 9 n=1 Tax=Planoprotostelium fungivorum TaxID=1890364 RepID=A0A2P6NSP9_9EUKA|nr:ran-binding protein 9 [Planoprotostelium fungivorum]